MTLAYAKIVLFFDHSSSLKEKRHNLKSILEKVKQKFNVSIAEVDDQNLWQKATVGLAYIALTSFQAEKTLRSVRQYIENLNKTTICEFKTDIIKT